MRKFCEKIGFPAEATDYFCELEAKLLSDPEIRQMMRDARDNFCIEPRENEEYKEILAAVAEKTQVHPYSVDMLHVLLCAKMLRYGYRMRGIDEEIYWDTMVDIRCKLNECKKMYGIWGTAAHSWYRGIMQMRTIKLGRLEYEQRPFTYDDYRDYAKTGDIVLGMHIPSCGPLTYEEAIDSLKKAYKFYGYTGNMVVNCGTWMIDPKHVEHVFPKDSNLARFASLFDIVKREDTPTQYHFWRIFYCDPSTPIDELPQDTTLQRNFVRYFKEGNIMGVGFGVIVFDGEKIIN